MFIIRSIVSGQNHHLEVSRTRLVTSDGFLRNTIHIIRAVAADSEYLMIP